MYCNLIHQKVIDNERFVGSYQHVLDRGRYDRLEELEKLENPAAPDCKSLSQKVYLNYSSNYINSLKSQNPDGSRFQTPNPSKLNSTFT
jgi:hypothetical protein